MSALVGLDVGLAVLGLAILAGFAYRLWRQVKTFGKTVSAAADRVGAAQSALDEVATNRPT